MVKKKGHCRYYTLVEIMTVIVIAAILLGIAIPAFTTMIQGNSMTVAIRQLSAKIQAARAYAIANRCRVAVLLLTNEDGIKDDFRYSAYRVCVVNSSNAFQEWIEDENWKNLPRGILRHSAMSGTGNVTGIDASDIGNASSSALTVPAVIFKENGQFADIASQATINLCQGRYVGSAIYTERSSNGNPVKHPIVINQYSGKVSVENISDT